MNMMNSVMGNAMGGNNNNMMQMLTQFNKFKQSLNGKKPNAVLNEIMKGA